MEANLATLSFLGFPICISKISFLGESNVDRGRLSLDLEVIFKLLYFVLQLVFGLSSDNEQPIGSPVIVSTGVALGRFVFRSQPLGLVGAFKDQILILAPYVQFIVELIRPVLHSQLFNTLVTEGNVEGFEGFALLWRNVRSRLARYGLREVIDLQVIFLALSTGGDLFGEAS